MPWLHGERARKLCVWELARPRPMCLFTWLLLYNEIAIINVVLSWVVCHSIEIIEPEGLTRTFKFVASWSEVQVAWGPQSVAGVWSEDSLIGNRLCLETCGVWCQFQLVGPRIVSQDTSWCQHTLQVLSLTPRSGKILCSTSQPLSCLSWTHQMPSGEKQH